MKRYRYRSEKPMKLFVGEMMICKVCGRQQKSDPHKNSEWTAVQLEGKVFYICPICFGNAGRK